MDIACIPLTGQVPTDHLLNKVADRLADDGCRLVGALRVPAADTEMGHCDNTLRLLPDGMSIRISQDLGAGSSACRLDAGALAEAAGVAETCLTEQGADLVMLNKFGLSEAEGRGFRALIAKAIESGVPVLIGLSDTHRAAFEDFTGAPANLLPADEEQVLSWCRDVAGAGHR